MKKIVFLLITIFLFTFTFINIKTIKLNATEENTLELAKNSKSAILIEASTKMVLYSKEKDLKLAPASMTKIMTMILVMESISKGKIKLDDMITTPEEASSLGGSQIFLETNEQMSVDDLLKSMAIASANDAAMSLAVYIGGNESNFVKMMNEKVKELGLENTNFVNPYGFDDPNHYTTSYDMAIMSSYLINNYPNILDYTSRYEDYVREDSVKKFWLVNTNKLVRFVSGVDGLKTGWTEEAGYCLTCTIKKDNKRFIAVSMGCNSVDDRTSDIKSMLNYGVNNYDVITYKKKGDVISEVNDITKTPSNYNIILNEDVNIVYPKGVDSTSITSYIEDDKYKVFLNNELYKEYELIIEEEVRKKSFFEVILSIINEMILG